LKTRDGVSHASMSLNPKKFKTTPSLKILKAMILSPNQLRFTKHRRPKDSQKENSKEELSPKSHSLVEESNNVRKPEATR